MAVQIQPGARFRATSNRVDSEDSFFRRLLNRKLKSGKRKSTNRQGNDYLQFSELPTYPMTHSPNTHPFLTKPFPKDEVLGGAEGTANSPELGQKTGSGLFTRRYTSWHSSKSLDIRMRKIVRDRETTYDKPSRANGIQEWEFFLKCYSEGRFNLSNPPEPPSQRPAFQYFSAPIPTDEAARLKAVGSCNLPLTAHAVEKCQRLIMLAKKVFQTRMGTFSLIDESDEVFKVEDFTGRPQISRHLSIGAHVLLSSEPMIVLDAAKDWRFEGNPIVIDAPWIRFYAGAPIVTSNGEIIGVFAVFDTQPRGSFTMANRRKLMDFARLAMVELELVVDERNTLSRTSPMRQISQIRPLCLPRESKLSTPTMPSTEERETVRARLLQSIEKDAGTSRRNDTTTVPRNHQDALAAARAAQSGKSTHFRKATLPAHKYEASGMDNTGKSSLSVPLPSMGRQSAVSNCGPHSLRTAQLALDRVEARPTTTSSTTKSALHSENYPANIDEFHRNKVSSRTSQTSDIPSEPLTAKAYEEATFATSVIAHSLGFDLVYLLRVCPIRPDICDSELSGHGLHTQILASHGMPHPEPIFDGTLHLRALRSDGGLVYSNQNKVPKDEGCGYQLGILLPLHREHGHFDSDHSCGGGTEMLPPAPLHGIMTKSPFCRGGVVLCAFTQAGRSSPLSPEKVRLFREFGGALRDTLFQRDM